MWYTCGMERDKLGIYIHVPYCLKKCRYCDFVSFEKAPHDEYFDMLAAQIREWAERIHNGEIAAWTDKLRKDAGLPGYEKLPACHDRFRLHSEPIVDSIFFGGGTPSLASEKQLEAVLDALRAGFDIAENAEISIEANPETITEEKTVELKRLGFNRVSIGVQSLYDEVLDAMGRVHSADKAREAFHIIRDEGFDNINLDLIFGAPEQDLEIWHHTLDEILAMRPEHLSFYSLQLEEGTPLYKDYTSGEIDLPSWEENREMYHSAVELMKNKGYHHYEVSNAAKPGYECRHNLKYWNMQPYLGFGISAHSFINGCRGEIGFPEQSEVFGCSLQPETEEDLKGDFIFTKLRLIDGFDPAEYRELFGTRFEDDFEPVLSELSGSGLLSVTENKIMLTNTGLDQTNPIMERLINICCKTH